MNHDPDAVVLALQLQRPGFALELDLRLPASGISVLFGPSGSGKTTVLRCVAGLEPALRGTVQVSGETWHHPQRGAVLPTHRRALGYVFQEASLFAHLNVRRNLAFGLQRSPQTHAQGQRTLDEAVQLLGIAQLLDRPVDDLSGGERQRVAIARALATQPRLLLLDEPLAALDGARKEELLPWLQRMREHLRLPMLYVTHSLDEMTRLADHLVLMDQGRVRASGPLAQTLAAVDAQTLERHEFGTVLEGRLQERDTAWHLVRVELDGGALWVRDDGQALGTRVRLRVLARDVSITTREPQGTSIQNQLRVQIDETLPDAHPSQMLVRLRFAGGSVVARITRRAWDTLGLARGQTVWAQVKSVALT